MNRMYAWRRGMRRGLCAAVIAALLPLGGMACAQSETESAQPVVTQRATEAARETEKTPEPVKSTEATQAAEKTDAPMEKPTDAPTQRPAESPSAAPVPEPSAAASAEPSAAASAEPSAAPSAEPSAEPSAAPSAEPSAEPSAVPSAEPSAEASASPSAAPTFVPTVWKIGKNGIAREAVELREAPLADAPVVKSYRKGEQFKLISGTTDADGASWYLAKRGKLQGYLPASKIVLETNADDGSGLIKTEEVRKPSLNWTGVVDAGAGGMAIPKVYQYDYRTVLCYYGGVPKRVSSSGCNVTCVSMVVAYLTGNKKQTPETMFDWAVDNGLYFGSGLNHEAMTAVAAHWGVQTKWIANDANRIRTALMQGYPVIAHMGDGLFTREGHYIVLRGVTEDGKILVNDPNSASNSGKAFPLSTILDEVRRSDSSFMVCYPPDGAQED